MCACFTRDKVKLERLVFFGDESERADLNKTFPDEDLEVLRSRKGGRRSSSKLCPMPLPPSMGVVRCIGLSELIHWG